MFRTTHISPRFKLKNGGSLKLELDLFGQALFRIFLENGVNLFAQKLVHLLRGEPDEGLRVQQLKEKANARSRCKAIMSNLIPYGSYTVLINDKTKIPGLSL